MRQSVLIPQFVNPEQAIRIALGKLGYPNLMQTMELDLVAWAMEARNLIRRDRRVLKSSTRKETVHDNSIPHCSGQQYIDCVKKDGVPLTFQPGGSCVELVTNNCCKVCCNSEQKFIVNECYTQFSPALPDGTEIEITALANPEAQNGYPMIPEVCVTAIAEYIKWMICVRERDNRAGASEARWYVLCRIARADLKKGEWSQEAIERFGYYWWSK